MDEKLKNLIFKKLEKVIDPEIKIPITEMGLIYEVSEEKPGVIKIKMTLTTMGCPLFSFFEEEIKEKILEIKKVKEVKIELTFDPPWTPARLSEKAKIKLSFFR